jgi:hypothetical protein
VDARLHYVQGEAEHVSPTELADFLQDFYRETFDLWRTRLATAQLVTGYDANNAYQQVLGRQEVHLQWLGDAIADLVGAAPSLPDEATRPTAFRGDARSIIEADVRSQRAFIERWAPRVPSVSHARNRKMLELILGEMKEHLRVIDQAIDGRTDLLGRHADGKVLRGEVLAARPTN